MADGESDRDADDEDDKDDEDEEEDDDDEAASVEGCRLTTSCSVRAAIATKSDTSVAQLRVCRYR